MSDSHKLHKFKKDDQNNLLLGMILVLLMLFAFDFLFPSAQKPIQEQTDPAVIADVVSTPTQPIALSDIKDETFKQAPKIAIKNNLLTGEFNIGSEGITDLSLSTYKETTATDSDNVKLLNADNYTTSLKWHSTNATVPTVDGKWSVNATELTPEQPVLLTFENTDMRIERMISVDNAYMMTVVDTIYNLKNEPVSIFLNGRMDRELTELPKMTTVHEGFVAVLDGKLQEEKYTDISNKSFEMKSTGGWMGLTDKYWMTSFIFDPKSDITTRFAHTDDLYTASFTTTPETISVGGKTTKTTRLFSGAKEIDLINAYQDELNIPKFDLVIDFGWFYFLTKPFLYFLNWLYAMVGNMGVAILIFATLLRIALLKTATKSYESMAKIRKIAPQLTAIRERYKDDKMRGQQETMALYKREKVNPAAGCMPMLIQIPIFFALYKVLSVSIQMRHAPFFGWIQDLSAPDPSSVFTLFGLLNWPVPSMIDIGILPILMGLTMWVQQLMNPAPADKAQATMMKLLPLIFTFMLGHFAAGLVIYWTWSNILSIAQQKYIMKKVGVK